MLWARRKRPLTPVDSSQRVTLPRLEDLEEETDSAAADSERFIMVVLGDTDGEHMLRATSSGSTCSCFTFSRSNRRDASAMAVVGLTLS